MIGKTVSHYKILEKLGEGGMGVVYRALDTTLDRHVALKFLPAHLIESVDSKRRFHNEAKSASALDHPNICTIYEFGEHEGQTFISMGLIEGETLEQRLKESSLSMEQTVEIAKQTARGLTVAHAKGIVHRDLKPANIMIDPHGVVKIMDFGLARREERTQITTSGSTLGTLSYMSPEQVRGEVVDVRSDLWSLGVILYQMILGRRPFSGKYDAAVLHKILNEHPQDISAIRDISAPLFSLVAGLLEKDSEDRISSAEEVLSKLNKLQAGEVSLTAKGTARRLPIAAQESFTSRLIRQMRRRKFLPIVGSYLAVAIGLLEVVPYLIGQYGLDPGWHQVALIWILSGFPLAGLIAYFHGRRGPDRISKLEILLFSCVILLTTGFSFLSWQISRGQSDQIAEQKQAIGETEVGVDLAELQKKVAVVRREMLDEKSAAEKANAMTKAKVSFNLGLRKEEEGNKRNGKGNIAGLTAAVQAYLEAKDAFKRAGQEALVVGEDKKVTRAELSNMKAAETARTEMMKAKLSVRGSPSDIASVAAFGLAQEKELQGQGQIESGDFLAAKLFFDEAQALYQDAAIVIIEREGADSAREAMLNVKGRIHDMGRDSPSYGKAVATQEKGEAAYIAGNFSQAKGSFLISENLYSEAVRETQSAGSESKWKQEEAEKEIAGLADLYKMRIATGDIQALRELGISTEMWERARFFESTQDRRAQTRYEIIFNSQESANVELSVRVDYKVKNKNQDPLRFNRIWVLEHKSGHWVIIEDNKAN